MNETGDQEFANRLRALLKSKKITQLEFDLACGFSPGRASRFMRCKCGVSLKTLRVIKQTLGCTWEELLGE